MVKEDRSPVLMGFPFMSRQAWRRPFFFKSARARLAGPLLEKEQFTHLKLAGVESLPGVVPNEKLVRLAVRHGNGNTQPALQRGIIDVIPAGGLDKKTRHRARGGVEVGFEVSILYNNLRQGLHE